MRLSFWTMSGFFALLLTPSARAAEPPSAPAASAPAAGRTAPTREPRTVGVLPAGLGVAAGQAAPDFSLPDMDGRTVRLNELRSRGPVLVVFYRGGWCPFCSFQIRGLALAAPEFQRRGVSLVAISVDAVEKSARANRPPGTAAGSGAGGYEIPFPVLSDPDLTAHTAYSVVHRAEAADVERLRGFGVDLEDWSGRKHHVIAVPSVFLVDAAGVVRWAHADEDYKTRPSVAQLLTAVDGVSGTPTR